MILAWLLVIPFVGGVLAALAGRVNKGAPRWLCLLALAAELALAAAVWTGAAAAPGIDAPWIPSVGARFILTLDGLSQLMVLLTAVLGLMAVLAGWKCSTGCDAGILPACGEGVSPSSGFSLQERQAKQQQDADRMSATHAGGTPASHGSGLFFFFLMWMLSGMVGIFLAMDLLLFYFFWEMMIIPLYFLIALWGGPGRAAAAIKLFVFTQVSGLLLLIASIALAVAHAQANPGTPITFSYSDLIGTPLSGAAATWLMLGFFVAFAVKLPAFGVHTWLVDAHTQAPASGAVDVSGLVIKVGAYGLLRFVVPLFPHASMELATFARVLAVAGILYGGVMAFAQSDLKRLVAYSSIGHMGFVLLGVFCWNGSQWNEVALQGVVLLILSSGIGSGALFIVIGIVQSRTGRRELRYLGGLWQAMPRLGAVGMFFALAAMGLPALASFVGEVLVLAGTFQASVPFAAVAAGGLVLSVIYALWLVQKVFQGSLPSMEETDVVARDLDAREWLMLAPAILITLWLGLCPMIALDTSAPSIRTLIEPRGTGVSCSTGILPVSSLFPTVSSVALPPSAVSSSFLSVSSSVPKQQLQENIKTQPRAAVPQQQEHGQDARATGGAP
jgi:NADH-quinone oxidoreductase subunit M